MGKGGHRKQEPGEKATVPAWSLADTTLVKRAQRQLPYVTEAYEALMRRYQRPLYRTCRRLLGDHDDAEEAAQEVMLKVFHALRGFEGRSTFKTWLFRITCNACHTLYQRKAREAQALMTYEQLGNPQVNDPIDQHDVDELLSQLSLPEREVLALRFVAGLKLREIAEVLAMNPSTVKMRLYRAIEKLKQSRHHR